MEAIETQPVISSIIVVIEGIKYEKSLCTIEVECLSTSMDDNNPCFRCTTAYTLPTASDNEQDFIIGRNSWEEFFGKGQTNKIERICKKAIKKYLEKENKK